MARTLLGKRVGVVQVGSPPPGPCAAPLSFLLIACACSRTPEPAPITIAPDPSVGYVASAAKKPECVRPSPDTPPPSPPPAKNCPSDPGPQPMLARTTIEFDNGTKVNVEIARAEAETSRGLMYRTSMPEDEGMIFSMDRRVHTFWMRNTCIPLDMLFIDRDGTIVGIEENVPTLNDDERSCGCASTHVLETNAGWSRRHGVKAGQKVKLPLP